jgi:ribosomal protein L37E
MNMKVKKCEKCGNETYQEGNICVLCKIGVTQMHRELDDLIKKNNKWNLHPRKAAGTR